MQKVTGSRLARVGHARKVRAINATQRVVRSAMQAFILAMELVRTVCIHSQITVLSALGQQDALRVNLKMYNQIVCISIITLGRARNALIRRWQVCNCATSAAAQASAMSALPGNLYP